MADAVPKFSAGPNYGPVLSSTDLYLLQASDGVKKLEIHPALTMSDKGYQIVVNIASGEIGATDKDSQEIPLTREKKDEPATHPRVDELHIITRYSPWVTSIQNRNGITLGDVLHTIVAQYQENMITEPEFAILNPRAQEQIRRHAASMGPPQQFGYYNSPNQSQKFKRAAWLKDKFFFDGLIDDEESYVVKRLGYKAPNVFVMALTT